MSFFRKAFNKIAHAPDSSNSGALKSPSTAALPTLSFQHAFGEAPWDGTSPRETTFFPIRMSYSNSSISPSSKISLVDKDSGFKTDDSGPIPPPKFMSGSYKEAPPMPLPKVDGELPRHRTSKHPSTSSFRPFLSNLAGLKLSSDKADTQDHAEINPPTLPSSPLSSNASTPIDIFPPPPRSKGRKRRQQNISAAVQSYLPYDASQAAVDSPTTKRLEEAAIQARLNAAITTETSAPVGFLPEEPPVSCSEDDEGPSNPVDEDKPASSDPLIRSLEDNIDYPPPPPVFSSFSWNEPFHENEDYFAVHSTQEQHTDSPLNSYLNGSLEKLDSKEEYIHPQALKDGLDEPSTPTSETRIPETGGSHDYSCSLIDDYAAPPTTPPPILSFGSFSPSQHVPITPQFESEIRLLRSRLAESKARIDSLAEEKFRAMQSHHREVLKFSESVKTLEQKEIDYRTQIKDLISENERLKVDRDDVVEQLKYQIEENENLEKANKVLQKDSSAFHEYRLKMRDKETEFLKLSKEKDSWQGQIDSMQHRLSDAERRVRCLDNITRRKYEAKQDGAYGSGSTVGRSTRLHFSPHVKGPSMDVVSSVTTFNEEVSQTASYIIEYLEEIQSDPTLATSDELARAKEVWGSKVVAMLQQQAQTRNHVGSRINLLLLQNCLEVFMTHWCVQIVEGWYPKQPSFTDILVELTTQAPSVSYNGLGKRQICGKQIKIIPTNSVAPDFRTWVKDVVQDLTSMLAIGGVRMPVLKTTLLPSKLEPLLNLAYKLRLALAERDICGGLDIAAPSPDVPFHPQFMEDAEESALQKSRKKKVDSTALSWLDGEYIAGTSGIGLKRTLNGQPGVYEMVVKPKVSLIRVLETVF